MVPPIAQKIAILPTLNRAQLLAIWHENFDQAPPQSLRKELMVPILAYRIQERQFGGLSQSARRRLVEIARSLRHSRKTEQPIQGGSRLVRIWRGEVYEVFVTEDGFLYRGQRFSSLSRIAREITGTQWSGPLFFGTRKS